MPDSRSPFSAGGANILYSVVVELADLIIQATVRPHLSHAVRLIMFLAETTFSCFVAGFALEVWWNWPSIDRALRIQATISNSPFQHEQ